MNEIKSLRTAAACACAHKAIKNESCSNLIFCAPLVALLLHVDKLQWFGVKRIILCVMVSYFALIQCVMSKRVANYTTCVSITFIFVPTMALIRCDNWFLVSLSQSPTFLSKCCYHTYNKQKLFSWAAAIKKNSREHKTKKVLSRCFQQW